jgi:hypothetical protein
MYKLHKNSEGVINSIIFDNGPVYKCIPMSKDNTDYAEFKKAVTAGAELQDADGNVMSEQAAQAFVATLP